MNKIKQFDARLDGWAESRWPGIINRGKIAASALVGAAIALLVVWLALKMKGYA